MTQFAPEVEHRGGLSPESNPILSTADLISRHLADPKTSWAIGTFGAIAGFHRDADEPVALSAHGAVTARGGIRLELDGAVRPIAWERPSAGDGWMHGIALCLPATAGAMNGRTTVTELGPDAGALKGEDRDAVLFDLGIGAPHCGICVRTGDPACSRAKSETIAGVRTSRPPCDVPTYSRAQRLARRVALRQLAQTDGPSPALTAWRDSFDREAG